MILSPRPTQLGNLVSLQPRPGKPELIGKRNQPPAEGVEDSVSQSRGKDGTALLHHLSRNPAEMLQSLKIIEAETVPFFSLAFSFPPFILETHYPHRGSSTQQMKHFSKAHCERLQCRQTILSFTAHSPKKPKEHLVHCIFCFFLLLFYKCFYSFLI